jgi:DNA-binding LacI/PurR family transcriptional regulator
VTREPAHPKPHSIAVPARTSDTSTPLRSAARRDHLVDYLRGRIVAGAIKPGEQLPTQAKLKARFNVSNDTVQSALHALRRSGFVVPRGRGGTVVVAHPPHLHQFALVVMEMRRPDVPPSRYHLALLEEARRHERRSHDRFSTYHLEGGRTDSENYQTLERDMRSGRLAGMFFTMPPFELEGTPVLDAPGIPRVTVGTRQLFPHVSVISASSDSWLRRAVAYLHARGRRNVALIALPPPSGGASPLDPFAPLLHAHGMHTEPYWHLFFEPAAGGIGMRNAAHLLFHEHNKRRPDALIIFDDNLVEPATTGMAAAGVRVPQDVEVVAMCNFPLPPASAVPVTRLGFDSGATLDRAVAMIRAQRSHEPMPHATMIEAVFEHELPSAGRR